MLQRILEFLLSLHMHVTDWGKVRLTLQWESWPWALPLLLVLVVFGYWSYQAQSTTTGKRMLMGVLRASALALVLLLYLRPSLVLEEDRKTPSVVAVWIDESASMDLRDPYRDPGMKALVQAVSARVKLPMGATRASRYDLALDALTNGKDNWLHKLAEHQHVAIFTGGRHAQLVEGIAQSPAQLDKVLAALKDRRPEDDATDVPTVVGEMFRQLQGQPVSAVVLLTDGRSTEGTLPTEATGVAMQHRTPIFAIPMGEKDEPLNLVVEAPQAPDGTFVKDPVVVKVKLRVSGLERPTTIKLHLVRVDNANPDKELGELASRSIDVTPEQKTVDTELIFKPEKNGGDDREVYSLRVRADSIGEVLEPKAAISKVKSLEVVDATVKVLLVDGYPRWEYRYLKNELIREKTVRVGTLLLSADEGFAQEGSEEFVPGSAERKTWAITRFPETADELKKYDVLLIGDVDPTFFAPSQMKLILDWVRKDGGGVGWIAGTQYNPDSYKGTPLDVLLPIIPDDPNHPALLNPPNEGFNMVMTPAGKESGLFRFFDDPDENLKQMEANPEMYWYKPVLGLQPTAQVLAVHPTRTQGGIPAPLIVTGQYAAGRTMFSAVADTWRWRRYKGEPLYQSYWLQMCRLLYRDKALNQNKRVELLADTTVVEVAKPVRVTLQIKDETLVGAAPSQLTVQVFAEDGTPLAPMTLSRTAGSQESYQGVMTATRTGAMKLQLTPGLLPVDTKTLTVQVEGPQREFADSTVDLTALTTLAERTEGKVVSMDKAGELANLIVDKSQLTLNLMGEELWNKPIALILVVVLVGVEWLIRKSAGLI